MVELFSSGETAAVISLGDSCFKGWWLFVYFGVQHLPDMSELYTEDHTNTMVATLKSHHTAGYIFVLILSLTSKHLITNMMHHTTGQVIKHK